MKRGLGLVVRGLQSLHLGLQEEEGIRSGQEEGHRGKKVPRQEEEEVTKMRLIEGRALARLLQRMILQSHHQQQEEQEMEMAFQLVV